MSQVTHSPLENSHFLDRGLIIYSQAAESEAESQIVDALSLYGKRPLGIKAGTVWFV